MKYQIPENSIPNELRKTLNDKVFEVVNTNSAEKYGITKQDIFASYTGKGGLHELEYNDYTSYYDYKIDKNYIEQGQFFTPYALSEWIINCLSPSSDDTIADLCCGHGSFINVAPTETNFYGTEIDFKAYKVAKYLYPDAKIENKDIQYYSNEVKFDFVLGNPPFGLRWQNKKSEFYYCIKSAELLKAGGVLAIIVPISFAKDSFDDKSVLETLNEKYNYVCQINLDKYAFKHLGVVYDTKLLILQKRSEYIEHTPFLTEIITTTDAKHVFETYLKHINKQRHELKNKLLKETMANDMEFGFKINKLLFDIKRHPQTAMFYTECVEYFQKYYTQRKPRYITEQEWSKERIQQKDVINKLQNTLRLQAPKLSQIDRLIKTKYEIKYNDTVCSINNLVVNNQYPFTDLTYKKLINKKHKEYKTQNQEFQDMKAPTNKWLDKFIFIKPDEVIKLNKRQKKDVALMLQKKYGFLQWGQGSGKTVAGIAMGLYRFEKQFIRNVFVISTAIAITNWNDTLKNGDIDFINLRKISDINNIKKGQFVTVSLGMLIKLQRHLKKYVKQNAQKMLLLFDESDNISSITGAGTKATLNVFRRLRYKANLTGTATRNTILEAFSQLELLYNNSYNMLCECSFYYDISKDKENKGDLIEIFNEMYQNPYPAYRKGYELFKKCHIPGKISVFGTEKFNQDILNADALKHFINKTIITRTFKEIVGKDIYKIEQIFCEMTAPEKELYNVAITKFYEMEHLFKSTGNSKKDAMLKILNQLILLLRICAAPQTVNPDITTISNKFIAVKQKITDNPNTRIAVGVRHINVAYAYCRYLKENFPNRPIFLITGQNTSLAERKQIIKKLEQTKNGILVCTQQSLSASLDIDCVDICMIPELHWNDAGMSQFYFRFIRFFSTRFKTVYFITNKNSIETNLLKLVMAKEKLNLFMKNEELSDDEIYDKYGIAFEHLQQLMYKEKTKDGYQIKWGDQEIKSA